MPDRGFTALDAHSLVARVLHEVDEVDSRLQLLGVELASPILPFDSGGAHSSAALALTTLQRVQDRPEERRMGATIPVLPNVRMGELVEQVKELSRKEFPAIALDLRQLAHTPPFGSEHWRPRTREELAELGGAAGSPLLILGVASASDAEVVVEAGLEGIVVDSRLGHELGGPSSIEVLPEILDAVAGMTGVFVSGPVRNGIDVFRYLAVGAEAVVVESDRSMANLEAELHYAMRLTGSETLADVGYESIYAPLFHEA